MVCPKFNTRRDLMSVRLVDSRSSLATIEALKPQWSAMRFSKSGDVRKSRLVDFSWRHWTVMSKSDLSATSECLTISQKPETSSRDGREASVSVSMNTDD